MAKAKSKTKPKASRNDSKNKHLQARVTYLFEAAAYLSSHSENQAARQQPDGNGIRAKNEHTVRGNSLSRYPKGKPDVPSSPRQPANSEPVNEADATAVKTSGLGNQRHLISHLRSVSRKSQVRLLPDVKRRLCRRCDSVLVPASASTTSVENASRSRRKPWADVEVIKCHHCGAEKRYPVGAKRQQPKHERSQPTSPKTEEGRDASTADGTGS